MLVSLIAAVDLNNGLGKNNRLLCHLPADLAHFKRLTINKPIIMGKNTFYSIGKPLPNRQNIVVSRTMFPTEGVQIATTLTEALSLVGNVPEVMIIGGVQLYKAALPFAQQIYLTIIHHQFSADVFFPVIDMTQWQKEPLGSHSQDEKNPYDLSFIKFIRKID